MKKHGGVYDVKPTKAGQNSIWKDGAPFMTLLPGMWDYDLRIKAMDNAKVDVAIVSLTCPNCFFGDRATSLKAAQIVNDSMAEQQRARADRIRWMASVPWQYPDDAKAELARAVKAGAVGVMQLANVVGAELTDERFAAVWAEIDRLGLPVLIHPGTPPGMKDMNLGDFGMVPPIGFMIDTTLAFSRMIYSGFLDRYPNVKLIAAHGGATLAVSRRPPRPLPRDDPGVFVGHQGEAERIPQAHLVRHGGVRPGRARAVHRGRGVARPRALRLGLPAQHRRHGRLSAPRRSAVCRRLRCGRPKRGEGTPAARELVRGARY